MTAEFTERLVRLARASARGPVEVAGTGRAVLPDAPAAAIARPATLTRAAARAELRTALGAIQETASHAGAANAVRLMRTVRTTEDARELATFASRFGPNTRAVAELTGKTSLRAFRVGVRGLRLLWAFIWSFLGWLAGLVVLRIVRRLLSGLVQLVRGAFVAVAVP
jgi:hypothetical protein